MFCRLHLSEIAIINSCADDRADLDILLPGGRVWLLRCPQLTCTIPRLKPEKYSHTLLFYFRKAFRRQDKWHEYPFCSIKSPFFSQQKATVGTMKTPISRCNAVFVMTAACCQEELWGGKHAQGGFSARVEGEGAIFFLDFGSENCSVVTFLWAVLHLMYISEVRRNETLNGNHFHTPSSCITKKKKKKRNYNFLWYRVVNWKMMRNQISPSAMVSNMLKSLIPSLTHILLVTEVSETVERFSLLSKQLSENLDSADTIKRIKEIDLPSANLQFANLSV